MATATLAALPTPCEALHEPALKRGRHEPGLDLSFAQSATRNEADMAAAYAEAVKAHPFRHNGDATADLYHNVVLRDGEGNVLGVVVRNALPAEAAAQAAEVLRPAATRTSLRANIYGGEAPHSGIAGYFDYRGSPVEYKYRKTAFTYENIERWPGVFAMVDYVSEIYRRVLPEFWAAQDAAIPDLVRIHRSPFSTLTINERFRTASHTDAGDFDGGYGCLACLEGNFAGLCLSFDRFGLCVTLQPRDVLIFNTHHFHSNTEPETGEEWSRLTCVFYYRAALGEAAAYAEYQRRLQAALRATRGKVTRALVSRGKETTRKAAHDEAPRFTSIVVKNNGENLNRAAEVHAVVLSPFLLLLHILPAPAYYNKNKKNKNSKEEEGQQDGPWVRARRMHAWCVEADGPSATRTARTRKMSKEEQGGGQDEKSAATKGTPCDAVGRQVALFGEPLSCPDGLAPRPPSEMVYANSASILRTPAMGGFKECDEVLSAAAAKEQYLELHHLSQCLGDELLEMWRAARTRWLELVREDWHRLRARCPTRSSFQWNNQGAMNGAFFDLCEVGRQTMLSLLNKEAASAAEEVSFWALFATHLHKACVTELAMPPEAMSLRKLNIKLKDFHFGGTRYFKDMPAAEQERRRQRRAALEQARRHGQAEGTRTRDAAAARAWLVNDAFDYQTEDCAVDYAARGWPSPADHAASVAEPAQCAADFMYAMSRPCAAAMRATVRVLIVLPRPAWPACRLDQLPSCDLTGSEAEVRRLLGNPAAQRLLGRVDHPSCKEEEKKEDEEDGLCETQEPAMRSFALPQDIVDSERGITIHYVYADSDEEGEEGEEGNEAVYDVVILQHVLCTKEDAGAAKGYVERMRRRARDCLLIAETDLQCRYYYMLKPAVRAAYMAVAPRCYAALHTHKYGLLCVTLRSKAELEALAPRSLARYKLSGSPLNTMLLLVPGTHMSSCEQANDV